MASRAIVRFFRTPKGLLHIVFAILTALAMRHEQLGEVGPLLVSAVLVAALMDILIIRKRNRAWEFPSGAVLTGLIIAMILSPYEPWYVAAATSAIAVVSKYVFRSRFANIFNPAALAIVITFYI